MVRRRTGIATAVALAGMLAGCGTQGGSPSSATTGERDLIVEGPMYAAASRYGDLVFTAGTLPGDTGAGIEEQVESALDNLEAALEAAGAGFDTLLKVNIYLTDWDNWEEFNSIYVNRIGEHGLPPRATVELVGLGGDSLIEIEAIAHVRDTSP
jgi:2-iminobutanoate/2-iminopropanoate deaminase